MDPNNPTEKTLNVLMLPWLAHGHANRYLELARRLTQQHPNLSVHFCSTPVILKSIRAVHLSARIKLVEIRLPDRLQIHQLHTTKHLPPHLLPVLIQTFAQSEQTFVRLLDTINPDFVIFDIFQPWAARIACERNVPTAVYIGCTVAMSLCAHDHFAPSKAFPFPAIKLTQDNRRQRSDLDGDNNDEQGYRHFVEQVVLCWKLSDFVISRSFREIEGKYIDYLSTLIGKELVLTGPLVPESRDRESEEAEKVMQWLDRRDERSVVFLSFGSECFLPYDEMSQLARGIELSGACFIWVARFPKLNQDGRSKELLEGLIERVGAERGHVITTWAPQRKILVHKNLGCFLTHCGWSSVIEGMEAGVPMIAMPMDWDQPANAKLIVELGIGVEVLQRGLGNFRGEDVAKRVKEVLCLETGEVVRRNAADLKEVMRNRMDEDVRILGDKIVEIAGKTGKGLLV